jgi:hypothetical protein
MNISVPLAGAEIHLTFHNGNKKWRGVLIMKKESKGLEAFNKVMDVALKIPGAKVNRAEFLKKELKPYEGETKINLAINGSIFDAEIPDEILDKIALSVLNYHKAISSAIAFIGGLPGGWWMAAAIPANIAQFYYNAIQLEQKLAYIYGWPDLSNELATDDLKLEIGLFLAVMMGDASANTVILDFANALSEGIAKRLPNIGLMQYPFYKLMRQIARWVGVKITTSSFADGVARLIPLAGGIFSGVLTAILMTQMGNRLIKHLKENPFKPVKVKKRNWLFRVFCHIKHR